MYQLYIWCWGILAPSQGDTTGGVVAGVWVVGWRSQPGLPGRFLAHEPVDKMHVKNFARNGEGCCLTVAKQNK